VPSIAAAASTPTVAGTAMSSDGPSPSCPQHQQRRQRQGKGQGEGEGERQEQRLRRLRQQQRQQQQRRPDVALLLQFLDRHHLDVARDASSAATAGASTATCPTCCTGVLRGSRRPLLHALAGASIAPVAGRGPCLVTLDGRVGSTIIGQLLQHHGLDSPGGHRLGRGLRRL
jgi:hypothetical protein